MQLLHIRHATSILYLNKKKILVDPVLNAKGSCPPIMAAPNQNKNPLTELPLPLDTILDCDAVLVTHTHGDHFDEAAAKMLPKILPILCQPQDEEKLKDFGFTRVIPIQDTTEWEDIKFIRTGGQHGHGLLAKTLGPVSGFILSAKDQPVIYITGDTVFYSYIEKILDKYKPGIVICFSGEARFNCGKPITMNAQDILNVCTKLPHSKVISVHMETWNHCRLTRKALREYIEVNKIAHQVYIPDDGEVLDFSF